MIQLTINGKHVAVKRVTDLRSMLESFGLTSKYVAVAVNGEVIRRDLLAQTVVKKGDEIEIVRPAGGG